MAPRRSSGGYFSSGPSCSSDAFATDSSRIYISFYALYLVVSFALFFIACGRFSRNKRAGQPSPGAIPLIISILFAIGTYLDQIIISVLSECAISVDLLPGQIVSAWLSILAEYILNAVIMIAICKKLLQLTSPIQGPALLAQWVVLGLIGLIMLAALGINTAATVEIYNGSWSMQLGDNKLLQPQKALWTTYYTVSVVGILMAASLLVRALGRAPQYLRSGKLRLWIIILLICALGFNLTNLGGYTSRAFIGTIISNSQYKYLQRSDQAVTFLQAFFYSAAFYAALGVAGVHVQGTEQYVQPVVESYNPPLVFSRYPDRDRDY